MPSHFFSTDIGACGLAWTGAEITGFHLPSKASATSSNETPPSGLAAFVTRIQFHLAGKLQDFSDAAFAFDGVSAFQQRVYRETLTVKPGRTRNYGDLAAALELPPGGSRAVAAALAANPWPLLVPCHRIIGANGKMTGFSGPGGVTMKARLLALEGAQLL